VRNGRASAFVYVPIGLLLLAAALLKYQHTSWEPFGQAVVVPQRVRTILIEIEAVLGVWLVSGIAPYALRPATIAYFCALAAASVVLVVNGEPSCGCFGRVTLDPRATLALDLLIIAVLAGMRRTPRDNTLAAFVRKQAVVFAWMWGGLAVLAVSFVVANGGVVPTWGVLLGDVVSIDPPVTDLGGASAGTKTTFPVTLHNRLARSVRVVGATVDCSCAAASDLPLDLPPHGSAFVNVLASFPDAPGSFVREFVFYTDPGPGGQIAARFRGRVLSARARQP